VLNRVSGAVGRLENATKTQCSKFWVEKWGIRINNNVMEILRFLLLLIVMISPVVGATLDVGYIAKYNFDGNANDSSGNNRNLSFSDPSNISYTYSTYFSRQVLNVNGNNRGDYFTSPDPYNSGIVTLPENLVSNYTFGMWLNPSSIGRNFPEWSYLISSANEGDFLRYGENSAQNNLKQFGGAFIPEFNSNSWQHVAVTKQGSSWTLYFNGDMKISVDSGLSSFDKNNYFLFNSGGWQYQFNGQVSEMVIYDRALSSSEVRQLVPEPSALSLLAVGLGIVLRRRRRTV